MEERGTGSRPSLRLGLEIVALVIFILIGIVIISPGTFSALFQPSSKGLIEAMYYSKLGWSADNKHITDQSPQIGYGRRKGDAGPAGGGPPLP